MSMLTPPGLGGKYRVTGHQYPRMRRPRNRRRIVLAAVSSVALLGLLGWGTVQLIGVFGGPGWLFSRASAASGPRAHCHTPSAPVAVSLPRPAAITVNVYNATQRPGLAKATAQQLQQRGFAIGQISNAPAPYEGKVTGVALLIGGPGPQARGALRVLRTQLASGAVRADPSRRTPVTSVDLIIGDGFASLDAPQSAARALSVLQHPAPTPTGPACDERS